jgi:hypothetical protein
MRAANANELTERAVPVLAARLSEAELADLIPVEFQDINDPEATAEPSKGALIQLAAGPLVVLFYGKESGRLVLESPASANATRNVLLFFKEVPIPKSRVLWTRPDVVIVSQQEAESVPSSRSSVGGRPGFQGTKEHSKKARSKKIRQSENATKAKGERLKRATEPKVKKIKRVPMKAEQVQKKVEKAVAMGIKKARRALKEGLEAPSKRLAKAAKAS